MRNKRIAIVHSTYYKEEMEALVRSAVDTLKMAGIPEENIALYPAPGSFEVPLIGSVLAEHKRADALIGLGIIVEGETYHARLLAENVARGIMDVQIRYRIPFAFEVLYVNSIKFARRRLDKGKEAAEAVLSSLAQIERII